MYLPADDDEAPMGVPLRQANVSIEITGLAFLSLP